LLVAVGQGLLQGHPLADVAADPDGLALGLVLVLGQLEALEPEVVPLLVADAHEQGPAAGAPARLRGHHPGQQVPVLGMRQGPEAAQGQQLLGRQAQERQRGVAHVGQPLVLADEYQLVRVLGQEVVLLLQVGQQLALLLGLSGNVGRRQAADGLRQVHVEIDQRLELGVDGPAVAVAEDNLLHHGPLRGEDLLEVAGEADLVLGLDVREDGGVAALVLGDAQQIGRLAVHLQDVAHAVEAQVRNGRVLVERLELALLGLQPLHAGGQLMVLHLQLYLVDAQLLQELDRIRESCRILRAPKAVLLLGLLSYFLGVDFHPLSMSFRWGMKIF